MPDQMKCFDDPKEILELPVCLNALSKNLKGSLKLAGSKAENCDKPSCKTLKTVHELKVNATINRPCDSPLARSFSGVIVVKELATAFDQDGLHRGFHAGDFEWLGGGGIRAVGRLSGMTNEGTHREPVFKNCQSCDSRGVMEGRLCGQVVAAQEPALKGCQIIAAYRLLFDPSAKGGSSGITGTLEGVIVCPCR